MDKKNEVKKLTDKDISWASFRWWLMSQLTYNYQRMQGGGFESSIGPILKKLYSKDRHEEFIAALKRHMMFFNTEPRYGAIIPGMAIALEEKKAQDPDSIDGETIIDLKSSLMGPLAGIGDTLTQALFKPIMLSICIGWASQGNMMGPIVFCLVTLAYDFFMTRICFKSGYKLGTDAVEKLLDNQFLGKITTGLSVLGLFVLGVMICKFVTVSAVLKIAIGSAGKPISLGSAVLDKILPKAIPLAITWFTYRAMQKGKSIVQILVVLFILAFIGGAIGLIG